MLELSAQQLMKVYGDAYGGSTSALLTSVTSSGLIGDGRPLAKVANARIVSQTLNSIAAAFGNVHGLLSVENECE